MTPNKQREINQIKLLYLFIFALGSILIAPTHLFSPPYFMFLRFPYYLEMMPSFLGVSWPATFQIYHWTLVTLTVIGSLNVLGITFYSKWKSIAKLSSFMGILIAVLMIAFFSLIFININLLTSVIYGAYSIVLLIVNILTFKALLKKPQPTLTRQKEASCE